MSLGNYVEQRVTLLRMITILIMQTLQIVLIRIKTLMPLLYLSAFRFLNYCLEHLDIVPKQVDLTSEFMLIVKTKQIDESGLTQ